VPQSIEKEHAMKQNSKWAILPLVILAILVSAHGFATDPPDAVEADLTPLQQEVANLNAQVVGIRGYNQRLVKENEALKKANEDLRDQMEEQAGKLARTEVALKACRERKSASSEDSRRALLHINANIGFATAKQVLTEQGLISKTPTPEEQRAIIDLGKFFTALAMSSPEIPSEGEPAKAASPPQ